VDIASILDWLQQTSLAIHIRDSLFAFPLIESTHVIGLTLVFGTIAIIDLRLLDGPKPDAWRWRTVGGGGKSGLNCRFPSRKWWRRRESNPRPKARRRGTLHACPLRDCQARRVETAKYRRALASGNLAATRRGAAWPPACLMAFDPQPPGEVKANVTA